MKLIRPFIIFAVNYFKIQNLNQPLIRIGCSFNVLYSMIYIDK